MGKKKNRFRKLTKKEEEDFGRFKTNQYEGQSTDQLMKTAMSRDLSMNSFFNDKILHCALDLDDIKAKSLRSALDFDDRKTTTLNGPNNGHAERPACEEKDQQTDHFSQLWKQCSTVDMSEKGRAANISNGTNGDEDDSDEDPEGDPPDRTNRHRAGMRDFQARGDPHKSEFYRAYYKTGVSKDPGRYNRT